MQNLHSTLYTVSQSLLITDKGPRAELEGLALNGEFDLFGYQITFPVLFVEAVGIP